MAKSRDAFRTISEVADWLDTPAHVLRFWESKFSQIKPVKRAGGRRYYRPDDMELLGGIKTLLHDQGMTIKGVQKLLREQGVRHVMAMGPSPMDDGEAEAPIEAKAVEMEAPEVKTRAVDVQERPVAPVMPPPASVVPLRPVAAPPPAAETDAPEAEAPAPSPVSELIPEPTAAPRVIEFPPDPSDDDYNPRSRFFAAFTQASPDRLASQAEALAPLLERLREVRVRLSRTP